jgi:diguanylate cyclase (GGDEF)-like protein
MFSYFKKSFKSKILLPTVGILVAFAVAMGFYLTTEFSVYNDYLIQQKSVTNIRTLQLYLDDCELRTRAAAVSMAKDHNLQRAIIKRDPDAMLHPFSPSVEQMYRVDYFVITDKNGVILARTHRPDLTGDLYVAQHVIDALNGKVSTVYDTGMTVKVAVRSAAPVYDNLTGKLLGVVAAGVRLDTPSAMDGLKDLLNSDLGLFYGDSLLTTTIFMENGGRASDVKMDPNVAISAIEGGKEYYGNIKIMGRNYKSYYKPLINSKGEVFATISLYTPMLEYHEKSAALIRNGFVIIAIGLVVFIILLLIIISSISKPLIALSEDMDNITVGRLGTKIHVYEENMDEVGRLSKSIVKVVNIIRKLIEEINITIGEHERGNTDYRLNADGFQGEYKALANNILYLSEVGIKDKLTGMPNRRSFDNRLALVWNHATREQNPVSVLMIDIDRFKNYNDSFGHQQGDLALQTTANVLMDDLLKRDIDFAARWGGEEFVVLLPNTYSAGALKVAEKIRQAVEDALIPCDQVGAGKITVSIGVTSQIPSSNSSVATLIADADKALYEAKQGGRNRVELN